MLGRREFVGLPAVVLGSRVTISVIEVDVTINIRVKNHSLYMLTEVNQYALAVEFLYSQA